jgi:hypothetical protein
LATNALLSVGLPVLFVDTCSILDIMRDPTRDSAKPHEMQAAIDLVCAAEANTVNFFMAEQVALEFATHDLKVQDEAKQKLKKTCEQIERINRLAAVFGATNNVNLSHLDDHVTRARAVVERWLAMLQTINPSQDAPGRAYARLNANKAPARQGKESSKDCLVYETISEKAAAIRAKNCSAPIVFLSSNTNDYCTAGGVLKPDIVSEFGQLDLKYAPNMSAAKHLLGL